MMIGENILLAGLESFLSGQKKGEFFRHLTVSILLLVREPKSLRQPFWRKKKRKREHEDKTRYKKGDYHFLYAREKKRKENRTS